MCEHMLQMFRGAKVPKISLIQKVLLEMVSLQNI